MYIHTKLTVIGKVIIHWTKDGKEYDSHAINYHQNDGQTVGQLRVAEEIYNAVEAGKDYVLEGTYGVSKNGGGYIRITAICNNVKLVQA